MRSIPLRLLMDVIILYCMFAVHMAVSGTGKATHQDDVAGRWRVKGDEFSLTVDRKSKSRMLEDLRYDTYNL